MARYRLRFLLQEFDLPHGTTVLGRGTECHVTIEDPLVSRQHARIVVDDEGATIADLGSRNGVRVNAQVIHDATRLSDGDRIRIGTQELVFCRIEATRWTVKTTGFLRHCANCKFPYPEEVATCPNCGGSDSLERDTLSGSFGAEDRASWSLQLLIEVLEKAMTMGRIEDAERVIRRATAQVEARVLQDDTVDATQLEAIARHAIGVSSATQDATWSLWVTQVYRRAGLLPPAGIVTALGDVVARFPDVGVGLAELATHFRDRAPASGEEGRLAHLVEVSEAVWSRDAPVTLN